MTYEQLQMSGLESMESLPKKSRLFPQDSHVSLTALRERVGAIVTSVTCGERLRECSEKFARVGSSVRIRPVYFQERINGISVECSMTLPRWGITWGGEYGELVTWERRTSGSECSLWRTPTASDGEFSGRTNANLAERWVNQKQKHLSEQVAYFEAQGGGYYSGNVPDTYGCRQQERWVQRRSSVQSAQVCSPISDAAGDELGLYGSAGEAAQFAGAGDDHGRGASGNVGGEWWEAEPDVGRVADGVSARVDRLRGIGNAVVPYQALPIFEAIAEYELSQHLS